MSKQCTIGKLHELELSYVGEYSGKWIREYDLHNEPILTVEVTENYCVTGGELLLPAFFLQLKLPFKGADHILKLWPLNFEDFIMEVHHEGKAVR